MNSQPDTSDEHYLRQGNGTQTDCNCGKSFGLLSDAQQHIQWQLNTKAHIDQAVLQARIDILEEVLWYANPDETVDTVKIIHILSNVRRNVYIPNRPNQLEQEQK